MDSREAVNPVHPYRRTRSFSRSSAQIEKARELRHAPTETERAAWSLLRSVKFKGFKFRRQHPVGPYIADFYCAQKRLIVELDGSVHGRPSQMKRDSRREASLRAMGYRVLRFPNGIVEAAPELFVRKTLNAVWSLPEAFG